MALIKCPECGHQVSDKANSCPNCGCPIISQGNQSQTRVNQSVNAKPVIEPEWVKKYRRKAKKRNVIIIISCLILACLSILFTLFLFFDKEVVHYTYGGDSYHVKLVWITLTTLGWTAFLFDFVIAYNVVTVGGVTVEYHNNHTIVLYDKIRIPKLIIDNVVCKFAFVETRLESHNLIYKFPDGELMFITMQGKNKFFDYHFPSADTIQNQTIVNNIYQTTVKQKGIKERSDMEKILIKNAKIDALASIDPTNTEKAKEQIDIVNKLDDLD